MLRWRAIGGRCKLALVLRQVEADASIERLSWRAPLLCGLLLLVVVAPLSAMPATIEMRLPDTCAERSTTVLTVSIDSGGQWFADTMRVAPRELQARAEHVLRTARDPSAVIVAHEDASHADTVRAALLLRRAGFERLVLHTLAAE